MTEPQDPFAVPEQPTGEQPPAPVAPPPPPGYGPAPGYPPAPPPPAYGQPPGYGQAPPPPGYGPPPGYPPAPPPPGYGNPYGQPYAAAKTNTLAIIALVACFFCSPAGLIMGIVSRNQIKQSGEGGSGLALAAIIVSAVSLAFFLFWVLGAVLLASAADPGPNY